MKRYHDGGAIPTLTAALSEHMNVDELKTLARQIGTRSPARKGDLVKHIARFLEGDGLRSVWEGLDDLQRAAVAEVVHSRGTAHDSGRFKARCTCGAPARRRRGCPRFSTRVEN